MTKAFLRRRNEFDAQTKGDLLFRVWLGVDFVESIQDETERTNFFKWYGTPPRFITDSLRQWGGLTPKQYEFARRKFTEATISGRQRWEARESQKQHLIQNNYIWTKERRQVTLEILAIKERMFGPKILGQTPEGMKLWVSLPNGSNAQKGNTITMTVTITPSEDDPTFAFGSRPSKWVVR